MTVANPYAPPQSSIDPGWTLEDLQLPSGPQRYLIVEQIRSIPLSELRPMCGNFLIFGFAITLFKVFRLANPADWVAALLDMHEVGWDDLPPQWRSEYESRCREAESLGFVEPHLITSPVIGPRMSVELIMSQRDGRIQSSFARETNQSGASKYNEYSLSMFSRLSGGGSLSTRRRRPESKPCEWQKMKRVRTSKMSKLLEIHQQRLALESVRAIPLHDAVEESMREDRRSVEDLIRRGVVRDAAPAEVFRVTQLYPQMMGAA